jgi:hypothetical protein
VFGFGVASFDMDGQQHRFGERKESEHGVNYSTGRNRQRARNCRHRRHQNVNSFTQRHHVPDSRVQSIQQAPSTSRTCVEKRGKYEMMGIFVELKQF